VSALPSSPSSPTLPYLRGYAPELLAQVRQLITERQLGASVLRRYPQAHEVRTDRALYDYVVALKSEHLRNAEPLSKVAYDNKLHVVRNALGTHTTVSRVQGTRLKAKREIRVASLFKDAPAEFLKMIVVHELAHMKVREHDKAFYALCTHMAPGYHQLEFDVRLWLTALEAEPASPAPSPDQRASAALATASATSMPSTAADMMPPA
jgi:UTP pyrophosphatase